MAVTKKTRHFSPGRLYKLSRAIVLVVSFILILLAVIILLIKPEPPDSAKIMIECIEIFPDDSKGYEDCWKGGLSNMDNAFEYALSLLFYGVLAPIVFFVLRGFYKYVFPVEKD